jgi:hypothetical protein
MPLIPSRLSWVACDKGDVVDLISKVRFEISHKHQSILCFPLVQSKLPRRASKPFSKFRIAPFRVDGSMARLCYSAQNPNSYFFTDDNYKREPNPESLNPNP